VFLVALGIDYNIFLMTRVREESIRSGTGRGALTAWPRPAASSPRRAWCWRAPSAMLGTLPLVIHRDRVRGRARRPLDTIIVRSVLVTALTLDIGRHIWWPSALHAMSGRADCETRKAGQ